MNLQKSVLAIGFALLTSFCLTSCRVYPDVTQVMVVNSVATGTNPCVNGLKAKVTLANSTVLETDVVAVNKGDGFELPPSQVGEESEFLVEAWCYGTTTGYSKRLPQGTSHIALLVFVYPPDSASSSPSYEVVAPGPRILADY